MALHDDRLELCDDESPLGCLLHHEDSTDPSLIHEKLRHRPVSKFTRADWTRASLVGPIKAIRIRPCFVCFIRVLAYLAFSIVAQSNLQGQDHHPLDTHHRNGSQE
jgi:hypothetical protein